MMKWTRTRTANAIAVGTASAVLLAACSTPDDVEPTETVDAVPVTISVAYWGNFGLEGLIATYEAENPHVTIVLDTADALAQHDALQQALIAGSGAPTVAFIDEGFITSFVSQADGFVNLLDFGAGKYENNYLPWKWAQASNADSSATIGLGADVGGLAMCYRRDLFEAAGLPADRADVEALIGNTWEGFVAAGQEYKAATGKKFVDNATNLLGPALTQLGVGYYDRNNELDLEAAKPAFDITLDVIEAGISANVASFTPQWDAGLADGEFAVLACPSLMLAYIEGRISADEFTGQWDIADIPGPGGNSGGAFYTIPAQGDENTQLEGYAFVEWLIEADQQIAIFQDVGRLPSQDTLYADPEIQAYSSDFFNGAPVGAIFTKSAVDIPAAIYYGPKHGDVSNAIETVLNDVQAGNIAIVDAWDTAVGAAEVADAS